MSNKIETFIEKYKCNVIKEMDKGNFNVTFKYQDENEKTYKFKDPRDTLNFLVRNWKLMETVEIETLFDYVRYGSNLGTFKHIDFYYLLMLEVIITFLVNTPKPVYDAIATDIDTETKTVINSYNNTGLNIYNKKLERTIRMSHLYAVGNTHRIFRQKSYKGFVRPEHIGFDISDKIEIDKSVLYTTIFNGYNNIQKITYQDGYILACTINKGNTYKVSKKNSCKLTTSVII